MRPSDIPPAIVVANVSSEQALVRNLINIMPGVTTTVEFSRYNDAQKLVVWEGLKVMRKSNLLRISPVPQAGETPEHLAARQGALDALFAGVVAEVHVGGEHDDTWDREKTGEVAHDPAPVTVVPKKDPDVAVQTPNPGVEVLPPSAPEAPPAPPAAPSEAPPAPASADVFAELP